ncbi:IS200/IS605 family transposase [Phormidesmis sp. 146-12]
MGCGVAIGWVKMAFWRTYYHLIWATKNRQPLILPEFEGRLYAYIQGKVDANGGILHAIGGVADHIHLLASIPPKCSVAEFVKLVKGSSSHYLNQTLGHEHKFSWQEGYGVLTLGSKQLNDAKAYVLNQKEHHTLNTAIAILECSQAEDD